MKLKRTKWKRMTAILGFVLFVLCLTAFSTTEVRAADDTVVWIARVNTNEVQSGEGWTYDPATHTLTLENYKWTYTLQDADIHPGWINAKGVALTICLKGENRITVEGTDNVDIISSDNDIIITGDGSLEVIADPGVDTTTFSEKNLTVKGGTLKLGQLYARGTLSIEGGIVDACYHADLEGTLYGVAGVQISGGEVYAKGDFKAIAGGRLSISGGLIEAKAEISLNGAVVIRGGIVSVESATTGIYARGDVEITAGSVDVTSDSEGIYSEESVDISGGVLTISSKGNGILALKCAKVTDGTVTITSGDRGIYADESISISGGTLTISSGGEGIGASDIAEIAGGTFTITSENDGIRAGNKVCISDGNLLINCEMEGIYTYGSVGISGGVLTISSGDKGINASECVEITDGTFTITSESDGIFAENKVCISDGNLLINSKWNGISSAGSVDIADGSITVTSVYVGIYAVESASISGGTYHFSTIDGAAVACVYVENGNYIFAPGEMSGDDGFFAMGEVNGKQVLFPINYDVSWNTAQENTLNALCEKYGVDNWDWDELLKSIAFIRDTSGRSVQNVMYVGTIDIVKSGGVDLSQGVEITFPASSITAKDDIIVFHLTEEGVMEHVSAKAGDGVITATFTSLSPVYYFKVENAGNGTNQEEGVIRLAGQGRLETSRKVATALKETLGIEKFETIVVATSKDPYDALAGSYLAIEKDAPILLTNSKEAANADLLAYVNANAKAGAKIYILGGTNAVSADVKNMFTEAGYDVEQLDGQTRLDTNKMILDAAGLEGQNELVIVTSKGFADSLSASATGRPILLVNPDKALNADQKAVLDHFKNGKVYIIGGESAVSEACKADIEAYLGAKITRVAGDGRYITSVEVAKTFFADAEYAVVATGNDFPDGLCGGPLAAALNAPLLLTRDGNTKAADYAKASGITSGYVLGGEQALADDTVKTVFSTDNITVK